MNRIHLENRRIISIIAIRLKRKYFYTSTLAPALCEELPGFSLIWLHALRQTLHNPALPGKAAERAANARDNKNRCKYPRPGKSLHMSAALHMSETLQMSANPAANIRGPANVVNFANIRDKKAAAGACGGPEAVPRLAGFGHEKRAGNFPPLTPLYYLCFHIMVSHGHYMHFDALPVYPVYHSVLFVDPTRPATGQIVTQALRFARPCFWMGEKFGK